MGLPQRVAAPPAADVLVDHRDEVDRLTQRLAQLDEERHVGRVQEDRRGVGILGQQRDDRLIGVLQQPLTVGRFGVEPGLDRADVGRVQPGLRALQHRGEPVAPGDVQPRRALALVSAVLSPSPIASST